ncbi:hypothetical protein ACNQGP_07470 [Flavobacterium sp. GT2N3]|uniref:hypothetical protein n=1 Tax=unclassified Flavobacterium TaxID=196869 RepID=UPI003AAC72C6
MLKLKRVAYFLGAKDLVLFGDIVPAFAFIFVRSSQKISALSGLRRNMFFDFQ